ncbi:unnamed protein product [Lathyrus oleraceus]|uniref:Plant phospholipase-like protein n=3 Tax=Pisum sativum TaxID=3888 RepID=A0A9D4WJA9_PEA|nr:uncharacterized protein LOC127097718 isoform X1 [Pisum sativum]KAI5401686.1 hypothetical protein KIW84_066236 [Pisum sativum]
MGVSICFTTTLRLVCIKGEVGESWIEMAQNPRVMPNCVYASNPYHECTSNCLQKIKESNSKPPKSKKTFAYRKSVTDVGKAKKTNEEKRTLSGCPKASNPYHECDVNCQKRMSGADSGVVSSKFNRRITIGSKPELPVLDNIPDSKVGAIYLRDAASPISKYYETKKLEPISNEIVPAFDGKPGNGKVQPKDGFDHLAGTIPTKQAGDKNSSTKVVPIACIDDIGEGFTSSAGASKHFSYSDIVCDNEDSDEEESDSVVSERRVPVGKYHVKESFASILLSIIKKYGDIGESCHLESVVMRSYYIECVCFVVQELQSSSIMHLTSSKVKELLAVLKDVESAQLRVEWLRTIVNDVAENIELINEHQTVETEKANSDKEMKSLQEELESKIEILVQKEQEVADIKTKIDGIRGRLGELEVESSEMEKNMLSIKSKVDNLDSRSLLDELL